MSSNLYWRPSNTQGHSLSAAMKRCLRKRYGEPVKMDFGPAELEYLHGLSDAGIEGVDVLVDAIKNHGSVRVTEEY